MTCLTFSSHGKKVFLINKSMWTNTYKVTAVKTLFCTTNARIQSHITDNGQNWAKVEAPKSLLSESYNSHTILLHCTLD